MDIYQELLEAKVPLDSHESDLYAKVTPESAAIIKKYKFHTNVSTFVSNVDGLFWYDIPFAYTPWWEARIPKLK